MRCPEGANRIYAKPRTIIASFAALKLSAKLVLYCDDLPYGFSSSFWFQCSMCEYMPRMNLGGEVTKNSAD